jgi:hypothetical protein
MYGHAAGLQKAKLGAEKKGVLLELAGPRLDRGVRPGWQLHVPLSVLAIENDYPALPFEETAKSNSIWLLGVLRGTGLRVGGRSTLKQPAGALR